MENGGYSSYDFRDEVIDTFTAVVILGALIVAISIVVAVMTIFVSIIRIVLKRRSRRSIIHEPRKRKVKEGKKFGLLAKKVQSQCRPLESPRIPTRNFV
ncbi:hypothetical protein QR680_016220 [Steinernema hermaphroditum]|uniref:Uncharacterized protein n=1 Tax=Steinernema hermaphroditum TaxID=289476 RepID=A0AA39HCZ8_9BILA|nr:hypothetical protein QR680_016220 [Steinernema hermaphroditum]